MLDLDAIKKRLEGLPEGPWYPRISNDEKRMSSCFVSTLQTPPLATNNAYDELTLFIAAARTDIPALIAEIERLNGVIRSWQAEKAEKEQTEEETLYCHECERDFPAGSDGEKVAGSDRPQR